MRGLGAEWRGASWSGALPSRGAPSSRTGASLGVYLTPAHAAANALVAGWMSDAGMAPAVDAMGSVVGRLRGTRPELPCLMLGSHLDTVRDAGRYDGALGVVAAIEALAALREQGAAPLERSVEVVRVTMTHRRRGGEQRRPRPLDMMKNDAGATAASSHALLFPWFLLVGMPRAATRGSYSSTNTLRCGVLSI